MPSRARPIVGRLGGLPTARQARRPGRARDRGARSTPSARSSAARPRRRAAGPSLRRTPSGSRSPASRSTSSRRACSTCSARGGTSSGSTGSGSRRCSCSRSAAWRACGRCSGWRFTGARWPDVIESQLAGNALVEDRSRRRRGRGGAAVQDAGRGGARARPHGRRDHRGQPAHVRGRARAAGAGAAGASSAARSTATWSRRRVIGVVVFVLLLGAGIAVLAFDRPLELVGRGGAVGAQPPSPPLARRCATCPRGCAASATSCSTTLGPQLEAGAGRDRRALGVRLRDPARGAGGGRLDARARRWSCSRSAPRRCSPRCRSRPAASASSRRG